MAAAVTLLLAGLVAFPASHSTRTTIELPRSRSPPRGRASASSRMYVSSPVEAAISRCVGYARHARSSGGWVAHHRRARADVQIARLSILERIELLRKDFPPGVTSPRVSNYVPEELSEEDLLTLTISGPYTAGTLQKIADEQVEPRLSAVPGVGNISVQGGTEPGVSVTYDPALLRQLGISPQALGDALTGARVVQALGKEQRGNTERPVVLRDQPQAVEDWPTSRSSGAAAKPFALGSLASVRPEEDARGFFFRINGQPAIAIGVSRWPAPIPSRPPAP
jgi:multidrug efflux pump subunit AcrB